MANSHHIKLQFQQVDPSLAQSKTETVYRIVEAALIRASEEQKKVSTAA